MCSRKSTNGTNSLTHTSPMTHGLGTRITIITVTTKDLPEFAKKVIGVVKSMNGLIFKLVVGLTSSLLKLVKK